MRIRSHLFSVPRFVWALVPAFLVLALAGPAGAAVSPEKKAQAKEHYRQGVTEYNLGRFEKAIPEFEQAYALDPAPVLLFNIGQSHRKLGNDSRAAFFFKRFLAESAATAKERPLAEKWIREIEEAEAAKRQAAVAPPPSLVPPPTAAPSPPPVTAPASPPPPSDHGSGQRAGQTPGTRAVAAEVDVAASPAPPAWQRPAAWATGGAAVIALAVGVQQHLKHADRFGAFKRNDACDADFEDRGSEECRKAFEEGARAKTIAVVGYVAGGVLAAASTALFVLSRQGDQSQQAAFGPRCRLLGAAASCTFTF